MRIVHTNLIHLTWRAGLGHWAPTLQEKPLLRPLRGTCWAMLKVGAGGGGGSGSATGSRGNSLLFPGISVVVLAVPRDGSTSDLGHCISL